MSKLAVPYGEADCICNEIASGHLGTCPSWQRAVEAARARAVAELATDLEAWDREAERYRGRMKPK